MRDWAFEPRTRALLAVDPPGRGVDDALLGHDGCFDISEETLVNGYAKKAEK